MTRLTVPGEKARMAIAAAAVDTGGMCTIHALALAVDARDRHTRHHSERVAHYTTAIALRIGLSVEYVERIAIAGTLHDVGKITVPDRVLLKPASLTDDEFGLVQAHCTEGERIVRALGMDDIATWIRHHHELWDGTGYPDGLAGERIPLPSRIVSVADAVDAMTTGRAYRQALSVDQATLELQERAGTQFDPQIADCMLELLDDLASLWRIPPQTRQSGSRRRLIRGGVVDREPSAPHVDPGTSERRSLGFEQPALARPLGQGPVGTHDPLPWNVGVMAGRHHRAGKPGRTGT